MKKRIERRRSHNIGTHSDRMAKRQSLRAQRVSVMQYGQVRTSWLYPFTYVSKSWEKSSAISA